nr:exopolygalacturonase-like isoform X2 [Ziziphus jujuba var. spinosa]
MEAFMQTWNLACKNAGAAKMVIPKGEFLVGPVVFQGPCKGPPPIVIEVQGTVKAITDISEYSSPEWFSFEHIDGLTITGSGTFDGQGATLWKYNDCKLNPNCAPLPTSLKFNRVNNSVVEGITSLNSQLFHTYTYACNNFTFHDVKISADGESPNTDGIHLSTSSFVNITSCVIGTGDDCVAIGQGTHNITVFNTTCNPGHGISVGSLGKYPTDKSVSNIYVKNCTLRNTMYGARIKTWSGKTTGTATTIVYEDIIVDNVKNPIILDQDYGRNNAEPSKWKVSDVHFRNFKGTSVTNVAVTLACSSAMPCEGVELANIDMRYGGSKAKMATVSSSCANAKTTHSGVQNPPPCSGSAPAAPGAEAPAAPDAKAPAAPDAKPPAAPDTKPPEASPS